MSHYFLSIGTSTPPWTSWLACCPLLWSTLGGCSVLWIYKNSVFFLYFHVKLFKIREKCFCSHLCSTQNHLTWKQVSCIFSSFNDNCRKLIYRTRKYQMLPAGYNFSLSLQYLSCLRYRTLVLCTYKFPICVSYSSFLSCRHCSNTCGIHTYELFKPLHPYLSRWSCLDSRASLESVLELELIFWPNLL